MGAMEESGNRQSNPHQKPATARERTGRLRRNLYPLLDDGQAVSFLRHYTYLSRGAKRRCARLSELGGLGCPEGPKAIRVAFGIRSTGCLISRNGNDSTPAPAK